jgi:SAM-dependent methyltransferase
MGGDLFRFQRWRLSGNPNVSDFDYSIYYGRFHDASKEHFDEMAKHMESTLTAMLPSERELPVVDVGCGYGFALEALRRLGFIKLQGLEISKEQAEVARYRGFKVALVTDTTEWLAAHRSQFILALLIDVLEHVEVSSQIAFLRGLKDSLLPGGRLIVQVPNANSILAARWRYNDYTHCSSFTEHSLYFVLRNAGFDDVKIDASKGIGSPPKKLWRAQSRQALRRYLVRWMWLQVFKAELPWEAIDRISFDLNLKAVAFRRD